MLRILILFLAVSFMTSDFAFASSRSLARFIGEHFVGRFYVTQTVSGRNLTQRLIRQAIRTQGDFQAFLRSLRQVRGELGHVVDDLAVLIKQHETFESLMRQHYANLLGDGFSKIVKLSPEDQFRAYLKYVETRGGRIPKLADNSYFFPELVRRARDQKFQNVGNRINQVQFVDDLELLRRTARQKMTQPGTPRIQKFGSKTTRNEDWKAVSENVGYTYAAPVGKKPGHQLMHMEAYLGQSELNGVALSATLNFIGFMEASAQALNRANRASANVIKGIHGRSFDAFTNGVWLDLNYVFGGKTLDVKLKHIRSRSGSRGHAHINEYFYGQVISPRGDIIDVYAVVKRMLQPATGKGPRLYGVSESRVEVISVPFGS